MDQRKVLIGASVAIIYTCIIVFVCWYFIKPEKIDFASNWNCKENGTILEIGINRIISVCRDHYVDIREVLNNKPGIRGIHLNIRDWKTVVSKLNLINNLI